MRARNPFQKQPSMPQTRDVTYTSGCFRQEPVQCHLITLGFAT